jgi:A118 family predicted phage portal protein
MKGDMKIQYDLWQNIYMNKPSWASYKKGGIGYTKKVNRLLLNMAKEACGELSNLVWSENPTINVGSKNEQEYLDSILDNNKFWDNMDTYVEYMAAFGGFMIKVYEDDGEIKLNFVLPDYFDITKEENGNITGAKFYSDIFVSDKEYKRVEEHGFFKDEYGNKVYCIKNYIEDGDKKMSVDSISATSDYNEVTYYYGLTKPLFVYVKNPQANNVCLSSPYGISIFANAISNLEGIDTKYDALNDEVVLGRM